MKYALIWSNVLMAVVLAAVILHSNELSDSRAALAFTIGYRYGQKSVIDIMGLPVTVPFDDTENEYKQLAIRYGFTDFNGETK